LFTPAFQRNENCGYKSPKAVNELVISSKREKAVEPPGPVSVPVTNPASEVELAP
jgi:hypothetical protein